MKRVFLALTALVIAFSAAGCTFISRESYNSLTSENSEVNAKNEQLEQAYNELSENNNNLKDEYDALVSDSEDFLKLSEDEKAAELARAEKDRIEAEEAARQAQEEADRLEAERKAQEEAERKAEEEARLAEEAKGYETGITFQQLSRNPDDYRDKKVKFTGNVLQVIEGSYGSNQIRLATSGSYDDVVLANYSADILDVRLLEDDVITIYGVSKGLKSYETIMGGTVTLPYILIDRIEFSN